MGRFWDARARENALYFIDNRLTYRSSDAEAFWANGERDLDEVLTTLGEDVRPDDVALDIGCGVGRLTRVLADRAERVYALDASEEMLARARELNPGLANVRWIHGDGRSLTGVADNSITLCVSLVVFQHIPDPAITLGYVREIGRVLRPGGRAVFGVSDDPSIHRLRWGRDQWRVRLGSLAGRAPRSQSHPAWRGSAVSPERVARAAAEAGMEVAGTRGEGSQLCYVRTLKS